MDPLDLKNAKSVLLFLSNMDSAMKSDLSKIVKSHQVLDNLLAALTEGGYLTMESTLIGPKRYTISLTAKGAAASRHLKQLDSFCGNSYSGSDRRVQMPPDWRERHSQFSVIDTNSEDAFCIVEERDSSGEKIREAVLKVEVVDERCKLRCEFDNSCSCEHVDYAWSLASIREMLDLHASGSGSSLG